VIKPVKADNISVIPKERYIMIQCTSLGLKKEDGLLIEDDSFYEMADYGYDLIYNPAITPFIEKMMEHAVPCDNGLKMLLYQGIIAYELWNDINVSSDLSETVYNNLCKKLYGDNIILTGYMGSGKSAVGKKISVLYGMDFIDTDEYIVEKEGMSINEIFERFGEDTFRKMETEALRELSVKCYNTVIATGGGIVLRKENVNILKVTGKIYYLMASPEEIYNRIQYDTTRPLLKSGSSDEVKEKIKTMMEQRRAYYDMSCDIKIETDGKTPEEIAELVYSAL
jgi:shikimate dehydrogenase